MSFVRRVSVYTLDGKYVSSFGQNSLLKPSGIVADIDGFVYVCSDLSYMLVFHMSSSFREFRFSFLVISSDVVQLLTYITLHLRCTMCSAWE